MTDFTGDPIDVEAVRECRAIALRRIEQGLNPQPNDFYDPCFDPDIPVEDIEAYLGIVYPYDDGPGDQEGEKTVIDYADQELEDGPGI